MAKRTIKTKRKFYNVVVQPTLLYGYECRTVKKEHERKIEVVEMRLIWWTYGKTLMDKFPKLTIHKFVGSDVGHRKLKEKKVEMVWTCS